MGPTWGLRGARQFHLLETRSLEVCSNQEERSTVLSQQLLAQRGFLCGLLAGAWMSGGVWRV